MPVDYSKWDNLELSDDSDIEVHPNVDKKSFIRAKQNKIHQDRAFRDHQIKTLQYEEQINDSLLERIDRLLTALKSHKAEVGHNVDQIVMQSMMESCDMSRDQPPPPPEGVHENVKEQPTYSAMMAALADQVKETLKGREQEDSLEAFIEEVGTHKTKVTDLQKDLRVKLDGLRKEKAKHITSEDLHDKFNYSNVAKASHDSKASKTTSSGPELLNPTRPSLTSSASQDSGADADIEDGPNPDDVDDEHIEPTPEGRRFAQIAVGDYRTSAQFITEHRSVVTERETDALLIEAFDAQLDGKDRYARQCVHQALLLQYCRQLGRDGVALFFKRITTPEHQARKLFLDDVNTTYSRIRDRAGQIAAERAANPSKDQGGVEQIQLHAVDPNTRINIGVPPADSADPNLQACRQIFESFPPNLQRALESGSLDKVNEVLGKMPVDEAEEVVGKLGEGGMLSLEEGIVDATTEEGQRVVEEIGRTHRMPGDRVEEIDDEDEEMIGEPGPAVGSASVPPKMAEVLVDENGDPL